MSRYYDTNRKKLVFLHENATPAFWDRLWNSGDLKKELEAADTDTWHARVTRRFLPADKTTKILEGGCGTGEIVRSLRFAGFDAQGIDFAKQTIDRVRRIEPTLPINYGDVTKTNFPKNAFDGYWSLGVIEHDYHGYQKITAEMHRILKPGGYAFITFPYLSPLRRTKARLGIYPRKTSPTAPPVRFYQYALNHQQVRSDLEALGFALRYHRPVDGFKGLKEEIPLVRPLLSKIQAATTAPARLAGAAITEVAAPFSGHVMLLVMQKL